ncbi:helicase-related protein [Sphingobacterium faecale]|uniref:DNA 3'-5' helicase n=1 Tax=Sphingobacterium faecale TaxID=2803775 RepID=A0ABS1QY06_9SPHI|nr:helicase-related protein [Sphingobacterium faecale]MBL1407313.1 ATP-dependent DNA helicase RecQ [Sphingobacterium faecale]
MTKSFNHYYVERISAIIASEMAERPNLIFVLLGQTSLWHSLLPRAHIADNSHLRNENKHHSFSEDWYVQMQNTLALTKDYHLISYAQLCYLQAYVGDFPLPFENRIVVIEDNLRQLFPLDEEDYIPTSGQDNIDSRPADLPLHHIEQCILNQKHYYSTRRPTNKLKVIPLFQEEVKVKKNKLKDSAAYNLSFDNFALDLLINDHISQSIPSTITTISYYEKQFQNSQLLSSLRKWNAVLSKFGGQLQYSAIPQVEEDSPIREVTTQLLKQHWGTDATFRTLFIYKDPDHTNEVIPISQGNIVDTIITAYENSKAQQINRDVFLTAPTGAGKSLIFQLPAFHISHQGDVTIVISPLIALMKDQVEAIITERKFEKAAYINGELSFSERESIIQQCQSGLIDILYMSPELFLSYDITYFIGNRNIGLLAIDEAHLITTWGRDFRVDYWFLGEHLRKLREVNLQHFTIVAVTATAVFGGTNDMVFDSIRSLHLNNPHLYIGQVKREDITFVFQNYPGFEKKIEANKLEQTVSFSKQIHELQLKTLVYTPYAKQISSIIESLNQGFGTIATGYHGGMTSENKNFALGQFKTNKRKIMFCTKAFGMGVDIPDVDMVYHHAPSGLFSDYIQEVGRAARTPDLKGVAAINYHPDDLLYAKTLHNMSSTTPYQIQLVLRKILLAYQSSGKQNNLLLSTEDFEYIFDKGQDVQQKMLTSLMFMEKNYILKEGFPVFTARPKKRFITGYAKLADADLSRLSHLYPDTYELISTRKNGEHIIEFDIEKFWKHYRQKQNFENLKLAFYNNTIFQEDKISLDPQLKIVFERAGGSFEDQSRKLQAIFYAIQQALESFQGFFTINQFESRLKGLIADRWIVPKISNLLSTAYINNSYGNRHRVPNAFLKKRTFGDELKYLNDPITSKTTFDRLMIRFNNLFATNGKRRSSRFCTQKKINSDSYVKLGNFLETLGLATFEIKGGDKTMVHIRINAPKYLEMDNNNAEYSNQLLADSTERQETSYALFNHFFQNDWTNQKRWEFIENYFLGKSTSSLLSPYAPTDTNKAGLKSRLEKIVTREGSSVEDCTVVEGPVVSTVEVTDSNLHIFIATKDSVLEQSKLLTIQTEHNIRTMRVSEWLMYDPVTLDKERIKVDFKLEGRAYQILNSKLRAHHFDYYRNTLRLQMHIDFPKYSTSVKALLPYTDRPVEFYKWWCDNPDQVTLNFREKLMLFEKVNSKHPKTLKIEHKKMISGK